MKIDGIHVAHSTTTRIADSVFYSSDGDNVYKNTAAGMRGSLGLNNVNNTGATVAATADKIVLRDSEGDIFAAGVTIAGNPGTLFSYSDGTRSVYGGCDSNDPWFGTSSNHDLRLVTYGGERMRIDNTGNVGIGTTSPATYLHLSANNSDPGATEGDFVGTHTLTEYMRFTSTGDGGDVNAVSVGFKLGGDDNSTSSPDGRLDICANDGAVAGNSYGHVPDKTIATFLGGGNVGIGDTSPSYKLDVNGDINVASGKKFRMNGTALANSAMIAATSLNVASNIVQRDSSGNFSAGTITAALTGNASTATKLATARKIGDVNFNGTADIDLPGVNTGGTQDTTGNAATATTATNQSGGTVSATSGTFSGDVGIGTTSPGCKLHVNGAICLEAEDLGQFGADSISDTDRRTKTYIKFGQAGTANDWAYLRQIGGSNGNHIALDFHDDGNDAGFSIRDAKSTDNPDTVTTRFTVARGGNVGIGTTNPIVPLDVSSYASPITIGWPVTYLANTSGVNRYTTAGESYTNEDVSIRASKGIWSQTVVGGAFGGITASDVRIKKSISDVDDDIALQKLRQLKPKRYKYRDERIRGDRETIGFIAQEVEQIVPEAVTTKTGETIPTILEIATVTASNILTFSDFSTASLESNTTTLQCYDVNNQPREITIASVLNDRSVQVKEDLSHWTASVDETGNVITETQTLTLSVEDYDALETDKGAWSAQTSESNVIECYTQTKTVYPGDKLYVQGEVVDDFHVLRKETIWALSTAALQEVDRQQQADKVRIAELESRVEELEAMVSIIKLNMTWPDA